MLQTSGKLRPAGPLLGCNYADCSFAGEVGRLGTFVVKFADLQMQSFLAEFF
jgi:hypothetical protein